MNKAKIFIIASVLIICFSFSSCLDKAEESAEVSNDCAITNMVIGLLQRVVHTKRGSGKDTTYVTTLYGSTYPMYIDQIKREIFNPDSLPLGTKVKSVVFSSITADGSVAYRTDGGHDTLYSNTDSLNFASPRLFTCYAYSGLAKKVYRVHVNVHKLDPEAFVWKNIFVLNDLSQVTKQKAFIKDNNIFVFAQAEDKCFLLKSAVNDGVHWEKVEYSGICPPNVNGIQLFKGNFYAILNGSILISNDGIIWNQAATSESRLTDFVCASGAQLFGIGNRKLYYSNDGLAWVKDSLDDSGDYLPSKNFASVYTPMSFNKNFISMLFSGTTSSGNAVLWKKTIDETGANNDIWSYYAATEEISHPLPLLNSCAMINYDNRLLFLGCLNDTVSLFYKSEDVGRSWIAEGVTYVHPTHLAATNLSCVVDENNYVWIFCGGSGQIWRGRINRLSFASNQTSFTK